MKVSNNIIREEFLLLAERLRLDTRFIPLNIIGTPECTPSFLDSHFAKTVIPLNPPLAKGDSRGISKGGLSGIYVGPYMVNWRPPTLTIPPNGGGGRLSDSTLESLAGVYKKLFLPHRQIRFIGVDLDDCLYDVTPIRQLLVQKIDNELRVKALDSGHIMLNSQLSTQSSELAWALYNVYKDDLEAENIRKQKASAVLASTTTLPLPSPSRVEGGVGMGEIAERTYHAYKDFSKLDNPGIRALYKPYEGIKDTLKRLMDSGDFVVGILTNGPSRLQREKIDLLGLKEGEHFNFVMVSEDVSIGKPLREFFELARKRASHLLCHSERSEESHHISNEECLLLEDQVRNISGADGWLKVQFLKGYHSNIQPENVQEIPKYGITRFSLLPDLLNLEKDNDFQAVSASYFILKSLLLIAHNL